MFQRKLIAVLGVVVLLAVTAGVGQASWSRVEGMGLTSPVLWQFTDDYANIYYYPTSVVRQNNLVLAELGSNNDGDTNEVDGETDQSLTVIKNFPRFGSIAYQMKQNALNSSFPNSLTHQQIDLIWGTGFEKMDIAVRFDATNSKFEHSESVGGVSANWEASGSGFDPQDPFPFGATFQEDMITEGVDIRGPVEINTWGITPALALHMQNDSRIEAAVTFRQYSLDRNETTAGVAGETWKDDGGLSYAINIRGILGNADGGTWYPAFWYVNDDLSWEVTGVGALSPRTADETYKNYGLGISRNMRVNDNNLLLFGVAAWQAKHSYERTDANTGGGAGETQDSEFKTTMAPIFFASLETEATSWLKVRLGGTQSMMSTRDESTEFSADTSTDKEKFSDFTFNIGAGLKWNNLDIDVTVNEAFPLSGGWVLSGDEETPFTRASATYHF